MSEASRQESSNGRQQAAGGSAAQVETFKYDNSIVRAFAIATVVWGLVGMAAGLLISSTARRLVARPMVALAETARRVSRAGKPIELTPREFDLLAYLLRHPGQVVTRAMLAQDVWRETNRMTPLDNVIDVHVAHLRRKVDEGHATKLIQTVRGVGFVLREEAPA